MTTVTGGLLGATTLFAINHIVVRYKYAATARQSGSSKASQPSSSNTANR